MNNLFSKEFNELDPLKIINEVNSKGYFFYPEAVNLNTVKKIEKDLSNQKIEINNNFVSPVWKNNQYYFTHALAASKTYFKLVTSKKIRLIAKEKFQKYFRLKCHRYYETYPFHHMNWHADNVDNDGKVHENNGLIFIIYINDVFDGEFQLIEGTNLNKNMQERLYNYTDKFVDINYKEKIKSFRLKAGSIIIYDTWHLHRAKPIKDKNFIRKSIFMQIDESPRNAEKILLNPEFFTTDQTNDTELFDYLGFGNSSDYMPVPVTNSKMLSSKKQIGIIKNSIQSILINLPKAIVKFFLSHDQISKISEKRRNKYK